MTIVLGIALFVAAGCAAAILVAKVIHWSTGPHDDAAERREQAQWVAQHHPGRSCGDEECFLTQSRARRAD